MARAFKIMGILNVTPDSFSDGGLYVSVDAAVKRALHMIAEGADIIDIGGESTRPYAKPVSVQEELDRVMPVLEQLHQESSVTLSVDTSKPDVIKAAIQAGATLINDIRAFCLPGALAALNYYPNKTDSLSVCVMHTPAEPSTMQDNPQYDNVVDEVFRFLKSRVDACIASGISKNRIIADPGIGFGKATVHNFKLLNQLEVFKQLGVDILVGVSRKTCIGTLLNKPVGERLYGSLAAAVLSASKGARIIRTHDVKETREALIVADAILNNGYPSFGMETFPHSLHYVG